MLHFFFNFFFQNHTRNYNRDLQPILNIKWPSRLNFASRKLTRTRLTIFFNVLQSIFFAIHIYNLQYNALPKKNFMNIFFQKTYLDGSGVFRSRGLFGLARDERWIRQKTEDFGILDLWTDFFPRPGFYSDSAEFCRKKKQLGDERIFSARQRFSKPNSQTDTQCACSQLGLSSQHTIGTFGIICSKIISDESQF